MKKYCDGCIHWDVCKYAEDILSYGCEHRKSEYDHGGVLKGGRGLKAFGMAWKVAKLHIVEDDDGCQEIESMALIRDKETEHRDRELWMDVHIREKD